ncbi:MAG: prephenate dehydrogenase [Erysipelotrichaceae bacterium]|nr:prephenate dehydrogenase [Erysipelotrichaceae bacterium]
MKTIGIVGLGVMGGSFAARAKELGYTVIGFDLNQKALDEALAKGILDEGCARPADGLGKCETVILCLYPTLMEGWMKENGQHLHPEAIVMEIGGVKNTLVDQLEPLMPEGRELVNIHPMCGREGRGLKFSSPQIFNQANFIIVPGAKTSAKGIVEASSLAKDLGCGKISVLNADEHDDMIAFLSQLTHVIAVCLMNTHDNEHLVAYSGDSFRDLTRIAKINEDMWSELFLLNKEKLLNEIDAFSDSLAHFRKALDEEDTETMKELFISSTQKRMKFDR